ncbi:MAG TPA: ABC transporter ATP-binding protein [Caulobacteraceae bacterium]|nr:ABC transporter ATP-binding protein [Caulobacteraceae bacterium]
MARIGLEGVSHAYDRGVNALARIDHVFGDGGAYALLGPSGCGKTTLLNIISGLITPSEGRVRFGDKDVTALPTRDRNIAQVFQFPVIYDTMTVAQNLAFPLKNRGVPAAESASRVERVLDMLDLKDWAARRARGLTADQKQKISLGRGLVRTDVNAVLFDEPLTVIDPQMKWRLRSQLKEIHRESRLTMVYVTHDQTEALTFADQVVVMFEGQIVQIGTPAELFDHPRHTFVGYFIGSPGMNLIAAEAEGVWARIGAAEVALPRGVAAQGPVELGIRPEHVALGKTGLPFAIERIEDIGRARIVRGRLQGQPLAVVVSEGVEIPAEPRAQFQPDRLGVFVGSRRLEPV